jgi:hypothetical protein
MPPRYTARRDQGKPRYSVWDNDKDGIAISEGRECTGFSFSEALDMARKLNDENLEPKQGRPTLIGQPAAQQQQPQPKGFRSRANPTELNGSVTHDDLSTIATNGLHAGANQPNGGGLRGLPAHIEAGRPDRPDH